MAFMVLKKKKFMKRLIGMRRTKKLQVYGVDEKLTRIVKTFTWKIV